MTFDKFSIFTLAVKKYLFLSFSVKLTVLSLVGWTLPNVFLLILFSFFV